MDRPIRHVRRLLPLLVLALTAPTAARGGLPATAPATRPAASALFADPGAARRVVFVCDASGSMIKRLAAVKNELRKAVIALDPQASFNLVFLQDDDAVAFDERGLVPATEANERRAFEFLDGVTTAGGSNPSRALDLASGVGPDLVYVLTDDGFQEHAAAAAERIKALNPAGRVRIHTISFTDEPEPDAATRDALAALAKENGGTFRHVNAEDLEPEAAAATAPATRPSPPAGPDQVFADPGGAGTVVFVCDASGSMASKLPALKAALTAAVDRLPPEQSFNVIFLQDVEPEAVDLSQPVPATRAAKRQLRQFLDAAATTTTSNPIPGLRLAFAQHPDVLYLLTDGDFPDNQSLLAVVRRQNRDHRVKVHTVAFVNDKDADTAFVELLKTIAKENGGEFRRVVAGSFEGERR